MPTTQIRADVAAAQDGDNRAFARLVDQTYSNVFLLAARSTRDHDDALDVVQRLTAFEGLIDYRGEASPLHGFIESRLTAASTC